MAELTDRQVRETLEQLDLFLRLFRGVERVRDDLTAQYREVASALKDKATVMARIDKDRSDAQKAWADEQQKHRELMSALAKERENHADARATQLAALDTEAKKARDAHEAAEALHKKRLEDMTAATNKAAAAELAKQQSRLEQLAGQEKEAVARLARIEKRLSDLRAEVG